MLTCGTGPGLDPDLAEKPNRIVLVEPFVPPPREAYEQGIEAIVVHAARAADATPAAGAKVANYLTSLLAIREARRRGAVEAIIVDARGSVLEGTTSNVFLVKDGELVTPPENAGILAGITRAYVLRAAADVGVKTALRDVAKPSCSTPTSFSFLRRCVRSCRSFAWKGAPSRRAGRASSPGAFTRHFGSTLLV
jgi:branched-chain amino acid aminotransferase